ncbi:hypothetical protein PLACP1_33000 [Planifilum fimeticola]|jgi:hypothetical protein
MAAYNGGWGGCPGDRLEEIMEISIGYVLHGLIFASNFGFEG